MNREEARLRIAKMITAAYTTGDFEPLFPLMTEDYEHRSFWVWKPIIGKETVLPYYRGKGNALKMSTGTTRTRLVRIVDPASPEDAEGPRPCRRSRFAPAADIGSICVLIDRTLDNGDESIRLAVPTVNDDGMLTRLLITTPDLFTMEEYAQ